jgi:hypothetical protein
MLHPPLYTVHFKGALNSGEAQAEKQTLYPRRRQMRDEPIRVPGEPRPFQKVLGTLLRRWHRPQSDCTQRFARVAIVPRPNRRRSAVTRVRPSTAAVAAKKRSAGSGC